MANRIPQLPPEWCLRKIRQNFCINPKTGIIRWKRDFQQMKKGTVVGSLNKKGYVRVRLYSAEHGMKYLAGHHVAWYFYYKTWPTSRIDHRNGIEDDNSRDNLRESTQQQNRHNSKVNVNNAIGHRGIRKQVYKGKSGDVVYYHARLCIDGIRYNLGSFKNLDKAISAREAGERKHFKEFAFCNRI